VNAPIDDAASAARRGELIVMPTDTVYGVGTRPDELEATDRLFAAKARPRDLELPVLGASLDDLSAISVIDERVRGLARAFWPGPLTVVVSRSSQSASWALGGDDSTIGVRVPAHPVARAVLSRTGPLAVSSANRSGEPTPDDCDELHRIFRDLVSVYLCDDPLPSGVASTVVDLTAAEPHFVREGALPSADVLQVLRG
jgi:L-threonylcarbamoyladenylate synthase